MKCVRLACELEPVVVCPICEAAYCDAHPPLNDGDATTCDACGEPVVPVKKLGRRVRGTK